MIDNILVSIIIPAYNAEKYIEETINSVLKQTHTFLELLIVDDGSTDKTPELVEEIRKSDERIKLIKQKNNGVAAARNTGLSASKGSYISYLDADDVWSLDFLESMLKKINSDKSIGLIHCDNQTIDENSQKTHEINESIEGYILDNLLLGGLGKYIFAISSTLIKREVILHAGGFDTDLSNGADHEFYFRVAKHYKIGRLPKIACYYRNHSNNMHLNIALLEKDTLIAYKKAAQYKLFKNPAFRRKCYSNMYLILAGSWWHHGNSKIRGMYYVVKSLFVYPPNIIKLLTKIS